MGDKTPATSTTNTSTNPWSAATPLLQSLIGKYGGVNTDVTGNQSTALGNLWNSASGVPNFGGTAAGGVSRLFSSDTSPQVGMLNAGYDQLQKNLGSTADGSQLDPYSTPGFSGAMDTMSNDITNRVKGVFAGSGRDPSGAGSFAQSLGRGLTQGEAPVLAAQYNANKANQMTAANQVYGASGTTAGNITGQEQVPLTNILSGLQGAGMIPGLYTAPAAAQVGAANAQQNQPFANLAPLLTAGTGLGAMGSTSSGTSTQTPANNPTMNWLGGISAGAGLMFSDARLKENIERVGELDDGQNVYTYNFRGDDTPQLGLLAQEVLEREPEAVHDVGGVLAVDYSLATRRARGYRVGMIDREAA